MNKNTRTWKILESLNPHADAVTDFDMEKELHFCGVDPEGPPYLRPESLLPSTSYTPLRNIERIELGNGDYTTQHVTEAHGDPKHLPHNNLRPKSPQPSTSYTLLQNVEMTDKNQETANNNSLLQDVYISDSDDSANTEVRNECILSESSSFNISSPSILYSVNIVAQQSETDTTAVPETESLLPGYQNRKRKRKGQANPKEWKKNERKIKRQKGEPYTSSKGVLKREKLLVRRFVLKLVKKNVQRK